MIDADDGTGWVSMSALACGSPATCTSYSGLYPCCPPPVGEAVAASLAEPSALRTVPSSVTSWDELLLPKGVPLDFGAGIVSTELDRDRLDVDSDARGAVWKDAVVDTILDRCDARDASNVSDWVVRTSVAIEVDWFGCGQVQMESGFSFLCQPPGKARNTNRYK